MRNTLSIILLIIIFAIPSLSAETKPNDKVILAVNAVIHATAHRPKDGDVGEINDEFTCQLTETVEYKIVSNTGVGHMALEMLSHKNRMTINGSGSSLVHAEGVGDNIDKWTYSIDPESVSPQAGITRISSVPPYKVEIGVADFFKNCNGKASGTSRNFVRYEGDNPIFETTPIDSQSLTYASTADNWVFESPEDVPLVTKGEMTALNKKLQGTYSPKKDGSFFTSGNVSHSYQRKDETGMMHDGSANITWSIQCGEGPERVKAVIIPKGDYKSWLPAAGTSADKPGNTISFDVELRNTNTDEKAKETTAQFEYKLIDTSAEPGSCGNSPWNEVKPDIQILKTDNPKLEDIGENGQSAKSAKKLTSSSITLSCFDGGAYSKLSIIAHLDGENPEDITAYMKDPSAEEISIPFDEDGNHIADKWESDNECKGKSPAIDEDEQPLGDHDNGDGLSIWEEYRGFLENGIFIRTDPRKKDYFICDTIGGKSKRAINRFAALTKLEVHDKLRLEELSSSRVMNRNRSKDSPHVVDQHGILLVTWSTKGLCMANSTTGEPSVPKNIDRVLMDNTLPEMLTKKIPGGATKTYEYYEPVAAHELLHACNVFHHGQVDRDELYWKAETVAGVTSLYEYTDKADCGHPEKGVQIKAYNEDNGNIYVAASPFWATPISIWQGAAAGQHSGNEDCVMRYDCSNAYYKGPNARYCMIWTAKEPVGEALCTSAAGTGVNAPGRAPACRYGDAAADRGDCIDKFCVNDLYH